MLFTTYVFFLCLIVIWQVTNWIGDKPKKIILLFVSYLFYASWDYRFIPLLMISTITDFSLAPYAWQNENQFTKKCAFILSLSINLGILGIFKYFNFF